MQVMAKTSISTAQLRGLMVAEIRKHDGCEDVTAVRILRSDDDPIECNWSAAVVGLGRAQLSVAKRAAMYAQSMLASKYDLLPSVDEAKRLTSRCRGQRMAKEEVTGREATHR